jgi:hypothetical protein
MKDSPMNKKQEIAIIDSIKDIYKCASQEAINDYDYKNNKSSETYTVRFDRWLLNDLNVMLQKYKKEIINNEIQ